MSVEFVTALTEWIPAQRDHAYRVLRKLNSTERECDRARGQLDVLEQLERCLSAPALEFGTLWPLHEEAGEEDEDAT